MQIPPHEDSIEFTACYWGRLGLTNSKYFFSGRNVGRGRVRVGHAPGQHQSWRPRLAVRIADPLNPALKERILIRTSKDVFKYFVNIVPIHWFYNWRINATTTSDFKREERRRLFVLFKTYTSSVFYDFISYYSSCQKAKAFGRNLPLNIFNFPTQVRNVELPSILVKVKIWNPFPLEKIFCYPRVT